MESGAQFLLFGYTFTTSGVAVFATNRSAERLAVIVVVSGKDQCASLAPNWPHPATGEVLDTLPIEISDVVLPRDPDWVASCSVFAFMLLVISSIIYLQYLVRIKYWTFPPPLRVEQDNEANEERLVHLS